MTNTSSRSCLAALAIASTRSILIERQGSRRPDRAGDRQSDVGDDLVRSGCHHRASLHGVEDVWRGEQVHFVRQTDQLNFALERHARRFKVLAKHSIDESDGREVLNAGEAELAQLPEKGRH